MYLISVGCCYLKKKDRDKYLFNNRTKQKITHLKTAGEDFNWKNN